MASTRKATQALTRPVVRRSAQAYRELLDRGWHGSDRDGAPARRPCGQVGRPPARAVGPQGAAAVRSRHRARVSTRRHG